MFRDGAFVKDLSIIPRNPKRLILVDDDERSFKRNPHNTILVKNYTEYDGTDDSLQKVLSLLVAMQMSGKDYPEFMREFSSKTKKPSAAKKGVSAVGAPHEPEAEEKSSSTFTMAGPKDDSDDSSDIIDPAAVIKNFTEDADRRAAEVEERKKTGLGGFLRKVKGNSANLRRGKVISPGAITFEEVMTTRTMDDSGDTILGAKMKKARDRQAAWEAKQRAAMGADDGTLPEQTA